MRVLMFGWEFPPHIAGGLGTACKGLTGGLAKLGVDITFVLPKLFGGEGGQRLQMVSADEVGFTLTREDALTLSRYVQFFAVDSFLYPYFTEENVTRTFGESCDERMQVTHWASGRFSFSGSYGKNLIDEVHRYAVVAASIGRSMPHDIIHAHDWLTYLAGVAAKRASGRPLVVHVHATEFDRSGENVNQAVYDIERYGMEQADRVVCVSHLTRQIVISRYGIDPRKVVTIHNAIDFSGELDRHHAQRPFPDRVVTFLGRITFQKGPDYFVEAADRVLRRMGNVRFVMAGSGDMRNRMVRRVAELGIASRFHFTGFLQGEDVSRLYALSDVYVMPSVSEPFGISPLEAMRSQVPVIISKQSGVAEVLKYVIKLDFWDVDALADSIHALLTYRALGPFFQKYGMQEVTNLKWESAAELLVDVYRTLLSGQKEIAQI